MQILEDNIEDYGDLAKRIAALHEQVALLLEQKGKASASSQKQEPTVITKIKEVMVESPANQELVKEIAALKKQLEAKDAKAPVKKGLDLENRILQKQIDDQKIKIKELQKGVSTSVNTSSNDDDLIQENSFLKKQIDNKDKTIKELGFKLEMLKMAKNLRSGAMVNEKSQELKKIINEYIKELDKNIASLNIK